MYIEYFLKINWKMMYKDFKFSDNFQSVKLVEVKRYQQRIKRMVIFRDDKEQ